MPSPLLLHDYCAHHGIACYFALIVLTTATFEKFLLEKKYGYLKEEVKSIGLENQKMLGTYERISQAYEDLYMEHQKLKKKR